MIRAKSKDGSLKEVRLLRESELWRFINSHEEEGSEEGKCISQNSDDSDREERQKFKFCLACKL